MLRRPVTPGLPGLICGHQATALSRRGKYLIVSFRHGHMLIHLGMSGSLRITATDSPLRKHDHVEWQLNGNRLLRFHDPRRFGLVLWVEGDPMKHPLLRNLGVEPLSRELNGTYLHALSRGRTAAIKNFIMDAGVVVGVGNIYASEALFLAGIHPARAAGKVSRQRYDLLVVAVKKVLRNAIKQGGTTLRDFVNETGNPGYFRQKLKVYGRVGEACYRCGYTIKNKTIGQRSSYYCSRCQC